MKIVNEEKKTVSIKELVVGDIFTEEETGEVLSIDEVIKSQFDTDDYIKVTLQRVVKEEE